MTIKDIVGRAADIFNHSSESLLQAWELAVEKTICDSPTAIEVLQDLIVNHLDPEHPIKLSFWRADGQNLTEFVKSLLKSTGVYVDLEQMLITRVGAQQYYVLRLERGIPVEPRKDKAVAA